MADSTPPQKKGSIPTWLKIFMVLLLMGTAASTFVYITRIQPVMEELSILRTEATEFRAMSMAQVEQKVDESIGWPEVFDGSARGKYARLTGSTGMSHQMLDGLYGGTLFFFPSDTANQANNKKVLLYFEESEPPREGSVISAVVWVSNIDPMKSIGTISPEQVDSLKESTPYAILIAKPLNIIKEGPEPEEPAQGAGGSGLEQK